MGLGGEDMHDGGCGWDSCGVMQRGKSSVVRGNRCDRWWIKVMHGKPVGGSIAGYLR